MTASLGLLLAGVESASANNSESKSQGKDRSEHSGVPNTSEWTAIGPAKYQRHLTVPNPVGDDLELFERIPGVKVIELGRGVEYLNTPHGNIAEPRTTYKIKVDTRKLPKEDVDTKERVEDLKQKSADTIARKRKRLLREPGPKNPNVKQGGRSND